MLTAKSVTKNIALYYVGKELRQVSKNMKAQRKKFQEEKNNPLPPTAPRPQYDFGVYEHTIITTINVVSSLLEVVLAEGIDVESYTMREAQNLLNGMQELLDIKKERESWN